MTTSVLIRYKLDQITYEWIKKETSDFYICILWQSVVEFTIKVKIHIVMFI